jgi:hypothetical protein
MRAARTSAETANAFANYAPGPPWTTVDGPAMNSQVSKPIWTALDVSSLTRNE